jgi:hypothetical protein
MFCFVLHFLFNLFTWNEMALQNFALVFTHLKTFTITHSQMWIEIIHLHLHMVYIYTWNTLTLSWSIHEKPYTITTLVQTTTKGLIA